MECEPVRIFETRKGEANDRMPAVGTGYLCGLFVKM